LERIKSASIVLCKQHQMDLFQANYSQEKYEITTSDQLLGRGRVMTEPSMQPQELAMVP